MIIYLNKPEKGSELFERIKQKYIVTDIFERNSFLKEENPYNTFDFFRQVNISNGLTIPLLNTKNKNFKPLVEIIYDPIITLTTYRPSCMAYEFNIFNYNTEYEAINLEKIYFGGDNYKKISDDFFEKFAIQKMKKDFEELINFIGTINKNKE